MSKPAKEAGLLQAHLSLDEWIVETDKLVRIALGHDPAGPKKVYTEPKKRIKKQK